MGFKIGAKAKVTDIINDNGRQKARLKTYKACNGAFEVDFDEYVLITSDSKEKGVVVGEKIQIDACECKIKYAEKDGAKKRYYNFYLYDHTHVGGESAGELAKDYSDPLATNETPTPPNFDEGLPF